MKEKYQSKAKQIFQGSKITITTEGHRYLGSVIGSKTFKKSYIKELVSKWCEELTKLSEIAKTQPQAAYAVFTSGYKHKFSYFMQTINCISNFVSPVENIIKEKMIPALFDGFPVSEEFRKLLALPCKLGGMSIIDPTENANDEYNNSKELISQLTNSIKQQEHRYTASDKNITNCKSSTRKKRKDKHLNILSLLRQQMSSKNKRLNNIAENKTVQVGLLYYLLNNMDFHYQKQNSGMHSIYNMGFH